MIKYELTFIEAIQAAMENKGWIQGEDYRDGVVFSLEKDGVLRMLEFQNGKPTITSTALITSGIYRQKFRLVYTQPDAERRTKQ